MQKERGLTMIELMVTVAILALLASLAGPSFIRLVKSNAMSSGVNAFMADVRYARSEAVRRGGRVMLCRSELPEDPNPVCAPDAGGSGKGWATGWFVFHDADGSGAKNAADPVLRVGGPLESVDAILQGTPTESTLFHFTATGRLIDAASATTLVFGGTEFETAMKRVVCVSAGGRARVAGDGSATCGADNE